MNDGKTVIEFTKTFIHVEYEALIAQYSETDNDLFQSKVRSVNYFLSHETRSTLSRPSHPNATWFSKGAEAIQKGLIVPRTVFQIKSYEDLTFGRLFRIYVSDSIYPI